MPDALFVITLINIDYLISTTHYNHYTNQSCYILEKLRTHTHIHVFKFDWSLLFLQHYLMAAACLQSKARQATYMKRIMQMSTTYRGADRKWKNGAKGTTCEKNCNRKSNWRTIRNRSLQSKRIFVYAVRVLRCLTNRVQLDHPKFCLHHQYQHRYHHHHHHHHHRHHYHDHDGRSVTEHLNRFLHMSRLCANALINVLPIDIG